MAVTLTALELSVATGLDLLVASRLLPVWSSLIEIEADAPEAIQNEAVIRSVAYYVALEPTKASGTTFGPISLDSTFNARMGQAAVLRNSGAREMLNPFKSHSAVTAKGST